MTKLALVLSSTLLTIPILAHPSYLVINISSIKKLRRDLCRTTGHTYSEGHFTCSRCKKKDHVWILSTPTFVGIMPIRKDVDVVPVEGSVAWEISSGSTLFWDGKNWIQASGT